MASAVMSLLPHLLSIVYQKAIKEIMHQGTGAFPLRRKSISLLSSSESKSLLSPEESTPVLSSWIKCLMELSPQESRLLRPMS
jgi:hypothetical protein